MSALDKAKNALEDIEGKPKGTIGSVTADKSTNAARPRRSSR